MKNILGGIWHRTRTFPDHKKTTQLTFLRKLREDSQRSKLSQEFSRTENRILGALARLDDFLMNLLIQGPSGTAPETSRNAYRTNQGTNEDDSQSDLHPEADIFQNQTTRNSGPEQGHDTRFVFFQSTTHFLLFFFPGLNQKTSLFHIILVFLHSPKYHLLWLYLQQPSSWPRRFSLFAVTCDLLFLRTFWSNFWNAYFNTK